MITHANFKDDIKKQKCMNVCKIKNIQIWRYTNIHVEKYKCEKCKRVCKEGKDKNYIKTIK